jgi:hypothetical protein
VPSEENNNLWPEDYSFWTSQVGDDSVPWTVQRSSPELYYLQSPNFNGAQEARQATATLQVCNYFEGGDMEVHFDANVRANNGQVFQVVVDGAVATGGDITDIATNRKLIVALSPGNHWVEFVYKWTPQTNLPTTSTGVVKIFSVTLPQLDPQFPTFTPTDRPSTSPSVSPSLPPTGKPTPRPTVSSTHVENEVCCTLYYHIFC